ncbi:MAG: YabP/YqfC family sporulation protein [Ruthenibacterium sp.]
MQRKRRQKKTLASPKEIFGFDRVRAAGLLLPRPVLHVRCDGVIEAEYCREILRYSTVCFGLAMGDIDVEITGDGLVLESLQRNRMIIHGRIFSIVFRCEKVGGKP